MAVRPAAGQRKPRTRNACAAYATQDTWGNLDLTAGDPVGVRHVPAREPVSYIDRRRKPPVPEGQGVTGRGRKMAVRLSLHVLPAGRAAFAGGRRFTTGPVDATALRRQFALLRSTRWPRRSTTCEATSSCSFRHRWPQPGSPIFSDQEVVAWRRAPPRLTPSSRLRRGSAHDRRALRDTLLVYSGEPYSLVGRPGLKTGARSPRKRAGCSQRPGDGPGSPGPSARTKPRIHGGHMLVMRPGRESQVSSLLFQKGEGWRC